MERLKAAADVNRTREKVRRYYPLAEARVNPESAVHKYLIWEYPAAEGGVIGRGVFLGAGPTEEIAWIAAACQLVHGQAGAEEHKTVEEPK